MMKAVASCCVTVLLAVVAHAELAVGDACGGASLSCPQGAECANGKCAALKSCTTDEECGPTRTCRQAVVEGAAPYTCQGKSLFCYARGAVDSQCSEDKDGCMHMGCLDGLACKMQAEPDSKFGTCRPVVLKEGDRCEGVAKLCPRHTKCVTAPGNEQKCQKTTGVACTEDADCSDAEWCKLATSADGTECTEEFVCALKKGAGSDCQKLDADECFYDRCQEGLDCVQGTCEAPKLVAGDVCKTTLRDRSQECPAGTVCTKEEASVETVSFCLKPEAAPEQTSSPSWIVAVFVVGSVLCVAALASLFLFYKKKRASTYSHEEMEVILATSDKIDVEGDAASDTSYISASLRL